MSEPSVQPDSQIREAAEASAINVEDLVAQVDRVLADPLYWFPVRHHSPAVARNLAECIRQRKPKIIFIEGPHEAQAMIEFLVDAKTRPPVAIYSSYRHALPPDAEPDLTPPRSSVWYPMLSYSPEFVAMTIARRIGAEAMFIDLPHYAIGQAGDGAVKEQPPIWRHLDQIAPMSRFYQLLSQAAGYRSWEETWDRLFELPREGQTFEQFRREIALFCAAVRATTPAQSLEADGTLPRERFMWQTIRQTLAEKKVDPRDAMVVCGGFHIFLDRDDPQPPPALPDGTLSVTVAPYSYFRISELSGYGAGNRAPRYYELCHNHHSGGRGQEQVVIDYVIDVIKEARKRGDRCSSADAISATQHAMLLARLRGKNDPVLDDIRDALITCCCKGNPKNDAGNLLEAIDEINIGTRLGHVTDRIGRLPIINDFYEQLDRLKLQDVAAYERVQSYELDKRKPEDSARSAFLHRLIFLGVKIGDVQREAAPFGQSIFKEHWKLRWSPQIEASLMERSLNGDTIESAATTLLRESLGSKAYEAGPACRMLVQAVDMDLPQLVDQAEQATGHAIDQDSRFHSLADALVSLMLLERYAVYRNLGPQRLADLISRCFDRACFAVPDAASVPPEQWEEVIAGLLALAEPVVIRQDLDADLFATHVARAASISTMPFLRGAFLGVLTEMRRMKPDQLAAELRAYARGSVEQQVVAGDFLHGMLRVSRTAILLGARSIVEAINELLSVAEDETFLNMIPRLRAAFETLHDRQRDNVASHVAKLYGLKEDESLRTLTASVEAAQLMASLDAQVAAIMKEWLGNDA